MKENKETKEHWNEDFFCADLRGKDFTGHRFIRCVFKNSRMDGQTDFYGAYLEGCDLSTIDGGWSNWEKSIRNYCNMTHSDFSDSNQRFSRIYWSDCKGTRFSGANLVGIETDFSRFQWAKFDGARLTGWSREIIAEILRQNTDSIKVKAIASWIKDETGLCWEQFLLLKNHPDIQPVTGQVIDILSRHGFAELIENGGRLCHTLEQPHSCQPSSAESEPLRLSALP